MTQHRVINNGDTLPGSFLAALQEFISTQATPNARLDIVGGNTVQIAAGTGDQQVGLGVMGRWRYIQAAATSNAIPGGTAAGTYDLYATASDNAFSNVPAYDTDSTVYAFGLSISLTGAVPGTALYRKIGTVVWDGAQITRVNYLFGDVPSVALAPRTVLAAGVAGQACAGRQLAVADFATLAGLPSTPVGLFNLGDTSNIGSGGALTNKGAVLFGTGVEGAASSAAVFSGSTAQALYISDTGAADPFRIRTGSFGGWFRTAKRGTQQFILTKESAASRGYQLYVSASNMVSASLSYDGTNYFSANGVTDVADDRWHFAVVTYDATQARLYVDGALEGTALDSRLINATSGPLNVGSQFADGATAGGSPMFGRIDEAFVTGDVLSDDQVRLLYAAKIAHGFGRAPRSARLGVRRRRRGGALAQADFPTPASATRIYNFTGGALADAGVDNTALTLNGGVVAGPGADGAAGSGMRFDGTTGYLSAALAAPAGTAARSIGAWFKTSTLAAQNIMEMGQAATATSAILVDSNGQPRITDFSQGVSGTQLVNDGLWHFIVGVFDPAPADGLKLKLYIDGRLVASGTTWAGSGTNSSGVAIGRQAITAAQFFAGSIDNAFIYSGILAPDAIAALYAKGAQALGLSPKNEGDHVEAMDATNLYVIADTLESQHQIDLAVAA